MMAPAATDDGKPCDTICRSEGPIKNDPIHKGPSAEAAAAAAKKREVDPFSVLVKWLAGTTRQHEGKMTAAALGWVVELEKAGSDDAVTALVDIAKVATASGRGDPLKKIADGVRWYTRGSSPSLTQRKE